MNRENILKVADAIENKAFHDLEFGMGSLHTCIECWACRVAGKEYDRDSLAIELLAHEFLDIKRGSQLSRGLFLYMGAPAAHPFTDEQRDDITPSQAVSVLRHLAETGKVDWNMALAESSK